jgi:C-terminal processing protease CtpA/Prc
VNWRTTFAALLLICSASAVFALQKSKSDDDKLGLKLTTAQYLTPGDISIQGVGVSPDVELDPMSVRRYDDKSWIRLQPSNAAMKPIIVSAAAVQVQGRVIGVLRKY